MWSLKTVYNWFARVVLLTTLTSFSGVSSTAINFQKTQTELAFCGYKGDKTTVLYGNALSNSIPKTIFNKYTVFNFKCLLIGHNFDINITFKSQKRTVLRFNELNTVLQQNLLAQLHSSDLHKPSIE